MPQTKDPQISWLVSRLLWTEPTIQQWGCLDICRTSLRNLFSIGLGLQTLLMSIPSKLNSLNPWKYQTSKICLCCFWVSLPGSSTHLQVCLASSQPLPIYTTWKTPSPVHACQPEGSWPVGMVGLLEKQTGIKYPQTNSQTFLFHLQKENNSGVNMQGIEHFERNCCSP